jgi:predicted neuraminidase
MIYMKYLRSLYCLAMGMSLLVLPGRAATSDATVRTSEFIYEQASFPQCHASTVVETTAGTLIAAFFGGAHEKHPEVGIWLSRHQNGRWSPPVEVANGIQHFRSGREIVRHPTWNPVLFQPKAGPLMLFYKVGPTPRSWWGMLMTSTDDGRTWSEPRRLPEGVLGPVKNKPVQFEDGTILCPSSAESSENGWTVHFEFTRDYGRTWDVVGPINTKEEFNAIQPSVLVHRDGRLQILCRSDMDVITTSWSADLGRNWSKMQATSMPNPNSGTDAVTLSDGRHLLVYNPTTRQVNGRNGARSPLVVALSSDGVVWHDVVTLETDDALHGYSYPAVIQTRDGMVHLTYTWRRERIRHVVLDPRGLRP